MAFHLFCNRILNPFDWDRREERKFVRCWGTRQFVHRLHGAFGDLRLQTSPAQLRICVREFEIRHRPTHLHAYCAKSLTSDNYSESLEVCFQKPIHDMNSSSKTRTDHTRRLCSASRFQKDSNGIQFGPPTRLMGGPCAVQRTAMHCCCGC